MGESTPYHHGNLKAELIELALRVLENQGLEALSLRALAKELGVSNNAPYRHFKSKENLLEAMATEGFLTLAAACKTETADWKQRLKESGLGYIRFARQNPALFRLMFGGYKFQSAAYREAAQAALEGLKDIIAQSGIDQPQARLLTAWGVVHGLSHILIDGLYADPVDEAQLAKAIMFWD